MPRTPASPCPLPPRADGPPIGRAVADQAADWLTLLMSGEATDDDRQRWHQWRAARPEHERAWQHVEAVTGRFKAMQPQAAYQTLSPHAGLPSRGRRKAVNLLLWAGAAGTAGLLGARTQAWQQMAADYRTGTGERRTVTLADDTRITLNTASAIDVRFDGRQRLVRLVAGEILVVTGHALADGAPDVRPFEVRTAEGRIRALGTRFVVRQRDGRSEVAVLESAVEVVPDEGDGPPQLLRAGERTVFTRRSVDAVLALDERTAAWTRGQIVADDMRLGDFVAELARYRPGLLRCDPAVAGLRFSGVFPLQDTDRILAALPSVLPVRVQARTRYWVSIEAAS